MYIVHAQLDQSLVNHEVLQLGTTDIRLDIHGRSEGRGSDHQHLTSLKQHTHPRSSIHHTHPPAHHTYSNAACHCYEAVQVEGALSRALSVIPVEVKGGLEVVQQNIHTANVPKREVRQDPHQGLADGGVGLLGQWGREKSERGRRGRGAVKYRICEEER